MRKILFLIVFFSQFVFSQNTIVNFDSLTIEDILALPEEEIDLGIACLVLAKDAYPDLRIETFDYILEYMADQINFLKDKYPSEPEVMIGLLNTYLYKPGWYNDSLIFTYDLDDLKATKKENQYLNGILSTRYGSCLTMSMLYLALADRLDWPIHPVRAPKHIFCRWIEDGFEENNIEPTVGGGFISNLRYIQDNGIIKKTIDNGVYLRTLTKKEYIASILNNNARHYYERENNIDRAIYYESLALSIDSTLSSAHWNLGIYYFFKGKELEQEMISKLNHASIVFDTQLQNLINRKKQQSQTITPKPNIGTMAGGSNLKQGMTQDIRLNDPHLTFRNHFPAVPDPLKEINRMMKSPQVPFPANSETRKSQFGYLPYADIVNDPLYEILENDYQQTVKNIREEYEPILEELLLISQWHKDKAKEIGIVLETPEDFFLKQKESIEYYRRTGKFEGEE